MACASASNEGGDAWAVGAGALMRAAEAARGGRRTAGTPETDWEADWEMDWEMGGIGGIGGIEATEGTIEGRRAPTGGLPTGLLASEKRPEGVAEAEGKAGCVKVGVCGAAGLRQMRMRGDMGDGSGDSGVSPRPNAEAGGEKEKDMRRGAEGEICSFISAPTVAFLLSSCEEVGTPAPAACTPPPPPPPPALALALALTAAAAACAARMSACCACSLRRLRMRAISSSHCSLASSPECESVGDGQGGGGGGGQGAEPVAEVAEAGGSVRARIQSTERALESDNAAGAL